MTSFITHYIMTSVITHCVYDIRYYTLCIWHPLYVVRYTSSVVQPDAIQVTQHALRRAGFVERDFDSADEFSGDISHEHLESAVVEQQSHVVVLSPLHDGSGEFVCGYPVAVTLHLLRALSFR